MPPVTPDAALPGQESVWRYPRPPIAEASSRHLRIVHRDIVVADTHAAIRTLETSHPPTYYLPQRDITMALLRVSARRSWCEWKAEAVYWDLIVGDEVLADVAWSYPAPTRDFATLANHLAFYATPLDACLVDGEQVTPQPGGFYGGWITPDLAGPFKGIPGSRFW
ncbi:MAG: DUF427 domain-containing protein [Pseudomonadota bacterium]|nr:DUF427 domain-containing protein [Pseudomonadota bacterium]